MHFFIVQLYSSVKKDAAVRLRVFNLTFISSLPCLHTFGTPSLRTYFFYTFFLVFSYVAQSNIHDGRNGL